MFRGQIGFALALMWIAAFGISGALSVGPIPARHAAPARTQDTRPQWAGLKQAAFGRDQQNKLRFARAIRTAGED
jgi:hypothetical protein